MHVAKLSLRLVALFVAIVGAMLAFNSLPPATDHKAAAAGPFNLTGTSCADIYFDLDPKQAKGTGPGPEDLAYGIIGESLTRTEPSQTSPGNWDLTTETYLGPDKKAGADPLTFAQLPMQMQNTVNLAITLNLFPASFRQTVLDLVPDQPSTTSDCKAKGAAAGGSAELGQMNPQTKFAAVGNKRPHATAIAYTDNAEHGFKCDPKGIAGPFDDDGDGTIDDGCPGGPAAVGPNINSLQFSTCVFSESAKVWVRTDVQTIVPKGPAPVTGSQTFGHATLWFGAGSPTIPGNPLSCSIAAALPFPAVIKSTARDETTDFTDTKSVALAIPLDPNGPNPNPAKFTPQVPDSADGLADDWDGDGCPDWNELDKDFIHGRDPFNPNDCGTNEHNYNGVFNILATAFPAAKQGVVSAAPIAAVSAVVSKTIVAGKHVAATITVPDGTVTRNQKVYWNTNDALQVGWWQVKRIVTVVGPTDNIEINRLFAPPCGLVSAPIPAAVAAPGNLHSVNCTGAVQDGNYFHCISRINDPKAPAPPAIRPLTSRLVCYIDSPALGGNSALPSRADGNAGAPPPPPYGTGGPTDLTGTFDPATQDIAFSGCFENTGVPTGPNVITVTHINAKTGKGFANLFFGQNNANCTAVTPAGVPTLQIAVTISEQNDNFDHDRDGCTDMDELASPAVGKCGDDPYNPYDSDDNISSNASILVTVARTDVGAPGFYFHCIAHVDQAKTAPGGDQEALTSRVQCYTDSTALTVNPPAIPSPNTGAASCPPAPAAQCGDGQPGPLPPLAFADVDLTHIVLGPGAGNFYDTADNTIHIEGCFTGVDNTIQGPNIYTRVVIAAHNGTLVSNGAPAVAMGAGEGLADIWPAQATCLVPGGAPPINDALIEFAENFSTKGPNPPAETGAACTGNADSDGDTVADDGCPENHYDTDLDGCTDTQELRNTQATGGLRDPYNRWDSMDQYTGSPLAKDRIVAVGDIGAVVSRFGTSGSATGDPLVPPALPTGYHVVADRSGALAGSNSWNLKQPDGVVAVGDIGAVVGQFGHSCTT